MCMWDYTLRSDNRPWDVMPRSEMWLWDLTLRCGTWRWDWNLRCDLEMWPWDVRYDCEIRWDVSLRCDIISLSVDAFERYVHAQDIELYDGSNCACSNMLQLKIVNNVEIPPSELFCNMCTNRRQSQQLCTYHMGLTTNNNVHNVCTFYIVINDYSITQSITHCAILTYYQPHSAKG